MTSFKKGDRVQCIKGGTGMPRGATGTVTNAYTGQFPGSRPLVDIALDSGHFSGCWSADRFTLYDGASQGDDNERGHRNSGEASPVDWSGDSRARRPEAPCDGQVPDAAPADGASRATPGPGRAVDGVTPLTKAMEAHPGELDTEFFKRCQRVATLEDARVVGTHNGNAHVFFSGGDGPVRPFAKNAAILDVNRVLSDWTSVVGDNADLAELLLSSRVLAEQAVALLIRKHKDYGPGNIARAPGGPLNGLRVRMYDKIERINHLVDSGAEPENESLRDSFVDLLNYSLIALLVLNNEWPSA